MTHIFGQTGLGSCTRLGVVAGGLSDGVQLLAQRVLDLQAPPLLLGGRGQHQGGHQV
jgi:hypothetical protein